MLPYNSLHSSLNSWPLLPSIINCMHIHVHTYIYKTCSTHVMLLVCTFSELTIWHQKNHCALPWGRPLLQVQHSSVAYGLFLVQLGMFIGIYLVQLTFGQSFWWDFMSIAFDIARTYTLTVNSLIPWLLQPHPLQWCSQSLGCRNALEMYPLWLGLTTLHFACGFL